LDIRGTGVFVVQAVACDDLAFCQRGHKKKILCENNFESMPDAWLCFVGGWGWRDCRRWRSRYATGPRGK
jgi:hypothetical protein